MLTFDDEYEVGHFIDGTPYVVVPSGSITIDREREFADGKNGAMLDPTVLDGSGNVVQGFDSRTNVNEFGPGMLLPPNSVAFYQDSARAAFPLMVNSSATPQSLLLAKSRDSVELGGMSNGVDAYQVLTILQEAPARPSFRPPYASGPFGKPLYNRGDIDYTRLPNLAVTAEIESALPDWTDTDYLRRLRVDIGGAAWSRTIFPGDAGDTYPAYDATFIGEVLNGMMLDLPERDELVDRLIQYALDVYAVAACGSNIFVATGGFGWGRLPAIVVAGVLLGDTSMQAAAAMTTVYASGTNSDFETAAFGEVGHTYAGSGGVARWGRPHDPTENPFPNHDIRVNDGSKDAHEFEYPTGTTQTGSTATEVILGGSASGSDDAYNDYVLRVGSEYRLVADYVGATKAATVAALSGAPADGTAWAVRLGGAYQEMSNFATGHALAIHLMGVETVFDHDPFLDFIDRFVSPDNGILVNLTDGLLSPTWSSPARPYGTAFLKAMWEEYR